jgi:hypothetical protein
MRSDVTVGVLKRGSVRQPNQSQKLVKHVVGVHREASASKIFQAQNFSNNDGREIDSQLKDPALNRLRKHKKMLFQPSKKRGVVLNKHQM